MNLFEIQAPAEDNFIRYIQTIINDLEFNFDSSMLSLSDSENLLSSTDGIKRRGSRFKIRKKISYALCEETFKVLLHSQNDFAVPIPDFIIC